MPVFRELIGLNANKIVFTLLCITADESFPKKNSKKIRLFCFYSISDNSLLQIIKYSYSILQFDCSLLFVFSVQHDTILSPGTAEYCHLLDAAAHFISHHKHNFLGYDLRINDHDFFLAVKRTLQRQINGAIFVFGNYLIVSI